MARVLIVDDDAAFRSAVGEALGEMGHEVAEASNGAAALAAVDAGSVDAVLLDLRMPGLDGLAVLRQLRERAMPPAVAVLTAHATAANTIEAMRLGAFDHLTKPVSRAEIGRIVDAMTAARVAVTASAAGRDRHPRGVQRAHAGRPESGRAPRGRGCHPC